MRTSLQTDKRDTLKRTSRQNVSIRFIVGTL